MRLRDVDFKTFCKEVENKQILCVGAGKLLEDMFFLLDKAITSKVLAVFDNYKTGYFTTPYRNNIKINNLLVLTKMNLDDSVILITSTYCRSIYEQLQMLLRSNNIDCYIYVVMSLKTVDYRLPRKNCQQMIPKIIHYFWFGKESIPEENLRCIDSWKKYCPDYEIVKWTEDNYDISKCKYMKQAYDSKKWGFVPDYARLDVIYRYGGIYLDTDVELVRNIDDLLYEDAFVGFQRDFWIALGLGFGGKKGNSIFAEMRDEYETEQFIVNGKLNLTASPYYQTRCLLRHGLMCNNQFQYIDNLTVFPTEVLDPQGYSFGKIKLTDNTYSVHHYSESWVNAKQREKNIAKYAEVNYFR